VSRSAHTHTVAAHGQLTFKPGGRVN